MAFTADEDREERARARSDPRRARARHSREDDRRHRERDDREVQLEVREVVDEPPQHLDGIVRAPEAHVAAEPNGGSSPRASGAATSTAAPSREDERARQVGACERSRASRASVRERTSATSDEPEHVRDEQRRELRPHAVASADAASAPICPRPRVGSLEQRARARTAPSVARQVREALRHHDRHVDRRTGSRPPAPATATDGQARGAPSREQEHRHRASAKKSAFRSFATLHASARSLVTPTAAATASGYSGP